MTTRDAIRTEIQTILGEIVDDPSLRLTDQMGAADVLYWDSHNHVRLLLSLAEQFGIKFSTQEIATERTVGDLVDLIDAKRAAQGNRP